MVLASHFIICMAFLTEYTLDDEGDEDPVYTCYGCSKSFSTKRARDEHIYRTHGAPSPSDFRILDSTLESPDATDDDDDDDDENGASYYYTADLTTNLLSEKFKRRHLSFKMQFRNIQNKSIPEMHGVILKVFDDLMERITLFAHDKTVDYAQVALYNTNLPAGAIHLPYIRYVQYILASIHSPSV